MIRFAPFLVFAYVLAGLVAGTSEAPILLGRYSHQAAGLIVGCFAMYGAILLATRRAPHATGRVGPARLEGAALLALVALTFVVTGSNAVQRLPYIQYVLPAVRVLAAAALIARESSRARAMGTPSGPMLAASMVLLVWGAADLMLSAATRNVPPQAEASAPSFRKAADLQALADDAIVLIGDSFVWGQGVDAGETLGAQLERRLRQHGRATKVYSLGVIGAGLRTYIEVVSSLAPSRIVDRIALVFYMNDLPAAPRAGETFRNQMIALGVGSPTLRIVGDLAARRLTPTLDDYHAQVARDYDPDGATFTSRRETLRRQLAVFHDEARARSRNPPLLVVLPLMVDFTRYPLVDAHATLAQLGHEIGYEVVDLLPVFREALRDGRDHRVSPDDNHFDAVVHGVVAGALAAAVGTP